MSDIISILLIDDDEDDFLITRDLLQEIAHQQYRIDWIDSYEAGLEAMREQSHDVYLVDFRLGVQTGLDLIREASERDYTRPIILLTGQGDFKTDAQAMKLGAADYLIKGQLSADTLERAIRYAIQQANNLQAIRVLNTELEERVQRRTQALRQAVVDLRQSQQLFKSIAQNFPNGAIMVLDRDLRFVFVDGAELVRMGFRSEELVGEKMGRILSPDEQGKLDPYLDRIRQGERLNFELERGEATYSLRGVPLEGADGQVTQVLLVCNNITREKKAAQEIHNALKKERQLNELKTRFVSMASHEFRTPLSTILSSISLLGRYTEAEQQPKREKHIQRIKSSVRNLTSILEDFLSLTRLEEGRIEVRPEPLELAPFFEEVIEDLKGLLKPQQHVELSLEGQPEALLDKQLLRNILNNLLSNAIKYSDAGSEVQVEVACDEEALRFSVTDQGIGIPQEEQVHLFERFFRAKNATNIQGTGLGLNILHKYVNLLHGQVGFHSVEGRGTVFTVHCPRVYQLPEEEESAEAQAS